MILQTHIDATYGMMAFCYYRRVEGMSAVVAGAAAKHFALICIQARFVVDINYMAGVDNCKRRQAYGTFLQTKE